MQDFLRRDLVERGFEPRPADAGRTQRGLRRAGRKPFVDQMSVDAETPLETLRETAAQPAHIVLRAVSVRRQPDHEACRPPFPDQCRDGGETGAIVHRPKRGQGMSKSGLEVPDRNADALFAEIERENRPRPRASGRRWAVSGQDVWGSHCAGIAYGLSLAAFRGQACPACSDRLA